MNNPFAILARCAGLVLIVQLLGCDSSQSVTAVPRPASNSPVLGSEKARDRKSENSLDLSFLNEGHFACFSLNVPRLLQDTDFKEIPWDAVEERLSKWVGSKNSQIQNIQRVWIVLDRSMMEVNAEEENTPWILVLDYFDSFETQPIDSAGLINGELSESSPESDASAGGRNFGAVQIGEHRIALGDQELTNSMQQNSVVTELVLNMRQMKLDSDIEGTISIGPIRNLLESMFGMVAMAGGESFASLAQLPELVQQVGVKLNFDSEQLVVVAVDVDDKKAADSIADLMKNTGGNNGSPLASLGSLTGPPSDSAGMVANSSMEWIRKIGEEAQSKELFTVEKTDNRITLELKRPEHLSELIRAMGTDWKVQIRLARRVEKLKSIAGAMRAYEEKHGCLPPSGLVRSGDSELPPQFNWRVGLLPYLDEQSLYEQFDFEKSWDHEFNLKLAEQIPSVFLADDSTEEDRIKTRIHVVESTDGIYDGDTGPKLSKITDGLANTAILIEGASRFAVDWTQPGAWELSGLSVDQFGRQDEGGVLMVDAKFSPRIIRKHRETIQAVLSPSGGESVKRSDFLAIPLSEE